MCESLGRLYFLSLWHRLNVRISLTCVNLYDICIFCYGVATISRLLKIIGLFCKRALEKRRYSAKETYHFKEPTTRSHPILCVCVPAKVSDHPHEYVMSHIWMSPAAHMICQVTHMNASCYTYESVRSHIWMSPATHTNLFCHTDGLVQGIYIYMYISWHAFEVAMCVTHIWVMSHVNELHVTHIWMSHFRVMSHIWSGFVTHGVVMALICMSSVTHINATCHIYEGVTSNVWMSQVTHVNESRHMCGWVMSHIWVSLVAGVDESCRTFEWVTSHAWLSHVANMNESRHLHVCE